MKNIKEDRKYIVFERKTGGFQNWEFVDYFRDKMSAVKYIMSELDDNSTHDFQIVLRKVTGGVIYEYVQDPNAPVW